MKRAFDLFFACLGLLFCLPLLIGIAALIKLDSRGPLLYFGLRAGQWGRQFHILKFRTMVVNAESIGGPSTSDDDPRVTRVGRLLRRWKLDEIPQFINIIKGEMSFVGPRPEVPLEVALYNEQQRRLLDVLPGITDYASIRFRNEGEILKGAADPHQAYRELIQPEKIRLGLEYVDNRSLATDVKIIFMTFRAVLCG
jgi:lipopolysaccharide/colanic/teichoic acid biosynthesis glycosyltransferase